MHARILLLLVALLLLRGASCLRVERPYPPPNAKVVLDALIARGQQVRTIRAETRMSHRTPQGRVKATVRLMASRGGKLRFDVVSPFDTPLATLVSNGERFALIDARENRYYHGPASPCNIARLLQVALRPDDALLILAGATPLVDHERVALEWDSRAGAEVLRLEGGGMRQLIRLDGTDRRWDLMDSAIYGSRGELLLEIKAADFQQRGSLRLPQHLALRQPQTNAELELQIKEEEVNLALPTAAFELPSAGGLPSQYVECQTRGQR